MKMRLLTVVGEQWVIVESRQLQRKKIAATNYRLKNWIVATDYCSDGL